MSKFIVVNGSQSGHCCFDWTVVDTTKPEIIGGEHYKNQFEPICECYEKEQADEIAKALNLATEQND